MFIALWPEEAVRSVRSAMCRHLLRKHLAPNGAKKIVGSRQAINMLLLWSKDGDVNMFAPRSKDILLLRSQDRFGALLEPIKRCKGGGGQQRQNHNCQDHS